VTLADQLLAYLRARLGAGVAYEAVPVPLGRGFDATTLALRLSGAPADFSGDLVLRVMPHGDTAEQVRREAAIHAALVCGGFPVPRILIAESDSVGLGRPFILMARLPGKDMWADAVGPDGRQPCRGGLRRRMRCFTRFRPRPCRSAPGNSISIPLCSRWPPRCSGWARASSGHGLVDLSLAPRGWRATCRRPRSPK
jgi:Phosphotransferase enzyme family